MILVCPIISTNIYQYQLISNLEIYLNAFPFCHGVPKAGNSHISAPYQPATRQAKIKNICSISKIGLMLTAPAKR